MPTLSRTKLHLRSFVALCACVLSLVASRARAQADDGAPAGYREAIAAAIQEYGAQSYAEAREQFRRAHRLFPNARTLRGLGMTEYELHRYPEAVRYLERALASEVKPLDGKMREDTEAVLNRARGYVGTVRLEIAPGTARVLVDNQRVEDPTQPLLLPVGDHVIDSSAPDRLAERRVVTIQGGQTLLLELTLLESEERTESESPRERRTSVPVYKRWWLWTTVAVLAGSAVAGAVLRMRPARERQVPDGSDNTPAGPTLHPFAWELGR